MGLGRGMSSTNLFIAFYAFIYFTLTFPTAEESSHVKALYNRKSSLLPQRLHNLNCLTVAWAIYNSNQPRTATHFEAACRGSQKAVFLSFS